MRLIRVFQNWGSSPVCHVVKNLRIVRIYGGMARMISRCPFNRVSELAENRFGSAAGAGLI